MIDLSRYVEDLGGNAQPLLDRHIPVVTHPYTRWNYITSVVVSELWKGVLPDEQELALVASYHDQYMSHWYGDPDTGSMGRKRQEHPFDIDGGANGRYLIKREHGGWGLRWRSWSVGPEFVPEWDAEPMPLAEVLDVHHGRAGSERPDERWQAWKADHPAVFGA